MGCRMQKAESMLGDGRQKGGGGREKGGGGREKLGGAW